MQSLLRGGKGASNHGLKNQIAKGLRRQSFISAFSSHSTLVRWRIRILRWCTQVSTTLRTPTLERTYLNNFHTQIVLNSLKGIAIFFVVEQYLTEIKCSRYVLTRKLRVCHSIKIFCLNKCFPRAMFPFQQIYLLKFSYENRILVSPFQNSARYLFFSQDEEQEVSLARSVYTCNYAQRQQLIILGRAAIYMQYIYIYDICMWIYKLEFPASIGLHFALPYMSSEHVRVTASRMLMHVFTTDENT